MSQKGLSGMMASLNPFGKSSKGRNGSGSSSAGSRGGGGRGAEVPRSFGINGGSARSSSERLPATGEGPAGDGAARRCARAVVSWQKFDDSKQESEAMKVWFWSKLKFSF